MESGKPSWQWELLQPGETNGPCDIEEISQGPGTHSDLSGFELKWSRMRLSGQGAVVIVFPDLRGEKLDNRTHSSELVAGGHDPRPPATHLREL